MNRSYPATADETFLVALADLNPPFTSAASRIGLATLVRPLLKFAALVVACCFSLGTALHAQTDLALNKAIAADSIQAAGMEANKANDGTSSTRWSSNFSGGAHWIYVDLLSTQTITSVSLNWEVAFGRDYTIETSANASTWTALVTVTGNATSGVHNYTGLAGSGRYVRVNCTLPSNFGNISLLDFNVFGTSGALLPNGTYTLAPANATGTRLDVAAGGTANGTNVDIATSNGANYQQWIFTNTGGNTYRLSPVNAPAESLDVNGQLTASGTNVQIWADAAQTNQRWTLTAVSGGYTLTPSHATALRLNATGATTGSNVNVTTANSSTAQTWAIVAAGSGGPLSDGTYTLAPANATGTRLDVAASGTGDGTNVDIVTVNNADNQKWNLTNTGGSTYRLSPAHAPTQALDVSGQLTASGTNVQTWTYLAQANQKWTLTAVSGGYTLTPSHATGLRLNATGSASGSNVNVLTTSGGSAQTWNIVAVTGVPSAPTNLTASAGNAQVTLNWNASSGATSYNVYRGTASNAENATPIYTGVTTLNKTDTTVTNGTTYFYKVKAVNASGTSAYSNEPAGVTPSVGGTETVGGGTIGSPAVGPAPSFGIGGAGPVLVKNWNFGSNGTIKNYADLNANFMYHDMWNTIDNGGNYGAAMSSPDTANALAGTNQPIEGVNCATLRTWTTDSLKTLLGARDGATTISPGQHNTACGSFTAKYFLNTAGSLLNQEIIWETRVRMVTPPYFWFAIWNAGTQWNGGAEMDVVESFGYDNGGGNTNYDGRFWHANSVGGNDNVDYWNQSWQAAMASRGISNFDATQYHTWTFHYKKDNTFTLYVDGINVQNGNINWTLAGTAGGTPVNCYFLFDAGWGHNGVASVNHSMPASNLAGKYYEWDYSRVYLKP
jgi:hypothetical protein